MVKKRMAMRMLTIFMALIVCGMFFPNLARGAGLSSDQGLDVDFEDVVVGEQKTIPLKITNQTTSTLILYPTFKMDAACEFTYTAIGRTELEPGATLNVDVTFSPSTVGSCTASLIILHGAPGEPLDNAEIRFTANGVEKSSRTLGKIAVGDVTTEVDDRMADTDNSVGDMIQECVDTAYTHGHLVRCVRMLVRELWREQIISLSDSRQLNRAAVTAEIYRMMREMRSAKRSGRRVPSSEHWQRRYWGHWGR